MPHSHENCVIPSSRGAMRPAQPDAVSAASSTSSGRASSCRRTGPSTSAGSGRKRPTPPACRDKTPALQVPGGRGDRQEPTPPRYGRQLPGFAVRVVEGPAWTCPSMSSASCRPARPVPVTPKTSFPRSMRGGSSCPATTFVAGSWGHRRMSPGAAFLSTLAANQYIVWVTARGGAGEWLSFPAPRAMPVRKCRATVSVLLVPLISVADPLIGVTTQVGSSATVAW
jgi:hypothetical protein